MKFLATILAFCSVALAQQTINASFPIAAAGATPGFVNEFSINSTLAAGIPGLGANPTGQTACTAFSICAPFADSATNAGTTALAGNLGIVAGHFANSTTLTPSSSDDKSDSFTCVTGASKDSGTNEWPYLCYFPNLTSGAHLTTTTIGSGSTHAQQVTEKIAQFNNIALTSPVDGTICGFTGASSNSATGCAVTTTQASSLVYALFCRAGTPATDKFIAGSGFSLETEDTNDGCASEIEVVSSAGPVTPAMTLGTGTASTYIGIVAAFKASASAAGTAPSGIHLNRMMSYSPKEGTGTSTAYQFTSTGNFLFASVACGNKTPSGVSDAVNGAWTALGTANMAGVIAGNFYVANAAANPTGLISVTTDAPSGDCGVKFYDFSGMSATLLLAVAPITSPGWSGRKFPLAE